eukprot:3199501-Amphidinium_carterae.1
MDPAVARHPTWISTCTGQPEKDAVDKLRDPEYLCRQLRRPVLFDDAIDQAYKQGDVTFVEISGGEFLTHYMPHAGHVRPLSALIDGLLQHSSGAPLDGPLAS